MVYLLNLIFIRKIEMFTDFCLFRCSKNAGRQKNLPWRKLMKHYDTSGITQVTAGKTG